MSAVLDVVFDLSYFYLPPHHYHHPPPLLKEVKPGWNRSMSLTDKLCAALRMKWFHSLRFHMWPLFYQWAGIEKQE